MRPRHKRVRRRGVGEELRSITGRTASTKSGTSHASAATSCGVVSAKKSTGKGITDSTARVIRTLPTFQVIVPTLLTVRTTIW